MFFVSSWSIFIFRMSLLRHEVAQPAEVALFRQSRVVKPRNLGRLRYSCFRTRRTIRKSLRVLRIFLVHFRFRVSLLRHKVAQPAEVALFRQSRVVMPRNLGRLRYSCFRTRRTIRKSLRVLRIFVVYFHCLEAPRLRYSAAFSKFGRPHDIS